MSGRLLVRTLFLTMLVAATLLGFRAFSSNAPRAAATVTSAPAPSGGLPVGRWIQSGEQEVLACGRWFWREVVAYDRSVRHRIAVHQRLAFLHAIRHQTEPSFEHLFARGTVLTHLLRHDKRIALTLDDGPSPLTPRTLAILARHKARATFFLVGKNAEQFPEYVKAIREGGHEIENHTYSHELGYPYTPTQFTRSPLDHQLEEVRRTDLVLHESTRYLRAPGGLFGPCWGTVETARELHKIIANWDVDGDTPGWQRIANGRIVGMEPSDLLAAYEARIIPGSIVLMHPENKLDAPYTVDILEKLIVDLQKKGYKFVTLDELLAGDTLASH